MIRMYDDTGREWAAQIHYNIGRTTGVHILSRQGDVPWSFEATGSASLHSTDKWDRKTGRKLAFTRALKALPRSIRARFWEAYWQNCNI